MNNRQRAYLYQRLDTCNETATLNNINIHRKAIRFFLLFRSLSIAFHSAID